MFSCFLTKAKLSFAFIFLISFSCGFAQLPSLSSGEIYQKLKKAQTFGTVLYIAAHPDDENTRLLSWFSNQKHFRTAYLSLTRGEGGQNLIGDEQGDLLGMIRTQELLEARKIDGAEQYFTSAVDFGYSKTPEETLQKWNKQKVLSDMVYVIRKVRPDIIITRFPTTGEGGHGHHTASAILAKEAFEIADNPRKFKEQLDQVQVWQPKYMFWNTFKFSSTNTTSEDQMHFDIGKYDGLLGKNMGEIASESRSMHKSQGFGVAPQRGQIMEYFQQTGGKKLRDDEDMFHELITTPARIEGNEMYALYIQKAIDEFDFNQPHTIIQHLLDAYKNLDGLQDSQWKTQKRKELEELIIACSGLWFDATTPRFYTTKSPLCKIKVEVIKRSPVPIKIEKIELINNKRVEIKDTLANNVLFSKDIEVVMPDYIPFSSPYWLNANQSDGKLLSANKQEFVPVGVPEYNWIYTDFTFNIAGTVFNFTYPVRHKWVDPTIGERYRTLQLLPDVTANFVNDNVVVVPGENPKVKVKVNSWTKNANVKVRVLAGKYFEMEPEFYSFDTLGLGDEETVTFTLKPLKKDQVKPDSLKLTIQWGINKSNKSYEEVNYAHFQPQSRLKDAYLYVFPTNIKMAKTNIAYVEGAGDKVDDCLINVGYNVTKLTPEELSTSDLSQYNAIILGIRAFNTYPKLINCRPQLMKYIQDGGNVIVQYNTNNFLGELNQFIGPYPFKITRNRVTDEKAKVILNEKNVSILSKPNFITEKDFEGWVQERGVYFAGEIDKNYQTPISFQGDEQNTENGSLIIAKYGKGNFIYTGISFFRQLPAGVPGAYRIMANLIASE
jgi:LmbE family N-acetylglucosaminyl deacetylase